MTTSPAGSRKSSFSDRTVSDKRDTREGGAAFPPRPDVRGFHAAILMTGATERATATRTLSEADFAVPISDRYFEDYEAGRSDRSHAADAAEGARPPAGRAGSRPLTHPLACGTGTRPFPGLAAQHVCQRVLDSRHSVNDYENGLQQG